MHLTIMLVFRCHVCRASLSADDSYAGQMMRCPVCRTAVTVPRSATGSEAAAPAPAPPIGPQRLRGFGGGQFTGRRYGFNCAYCSSRLEATDSMAAQEGQCPTCGSQITIPIQGRHGELIDPKTRQIIKQDPHPVRAYAAAGDRTPHIVRNADGRQNIVCPRCSAASPITANNCRSCGMPFTMEGTTLEASGTNNGFCVASLVLGIIAVPGSCFVVPPILAIIFGIIGLQQVSKSDGTGGSGRGMAIAGIILGVIGGLVTMKILL